MKTKTFAARSPDELDKQLAAFLRENAITPDTYTAHYALVWDNQILCVVYSCLLFYVPLYPAGIAPKVWG